MHDFCANRRDHFRLAELFSTVGAGPGKRVRKLIQSQVVRAAHEEIDDGRHRIEPLRRPGLRDEQREQCRTANPSVGIRMDARTGLRRPENETGIGATEPHQRSEIPLQLVAFRVVPPWLEL
jgi:hypothetical protein